MNGNETKRFALADVLSITIEHCVSARRMDAIYDILNWMTNDNLFTHQLPRAARECIPWLLRWFPELAPCGVEKSIDSMKAWIAKDRTADKSEGVKMWLAELRMMFPALADTYDVPRIPQDDHDRKDPIEEAIEAFGEGKVITVGM